MPLQVQPSAFAKRAINRSGGTLLQGHAVVQHADGDECVRYATAAEGFDGVLEYDLLDGEVGTMLTGGVVPIAGDAAGRAGVGLAIGADGIFTATAATNYVAAVVDKAATAAGITNALIYPGRKLAT